MEAIEKNKGNTHTVYFMQILNLFCICFSAQPNLGPLLYFPFAPEFKIKNVYQQQLTTTTAGSMYITTTKKSTMSCQ